MKNFFKFNLFLFISLSILISQLSLPGIFLYQNKDISSSVNIAQASDADAWYDADWSYRKEITINHTQVVNENLSNYPFLFSATDDDFKVITEEGNVGQPDGGDILFTLDDGTTKLSHEIEVYDGATGRVEAWIKIPSLSYEEDTKLYVYYGNAAADDQQDENNVWDANYKMVQHLNESPNNGISGGHADSTVNDMDGTADRFYGTATTNALGKIGGADIFKNIVYAPYYWNDPINYYSRVSLPSSLLGNQESFTLSSWIRSNAAGAILSNNGGETDYCTLSGYAYYAFYLQRVAFNTISNSSTTYAGNVYSDYTNVSTTVQAGQTYTLTTTNAPYMHHSIKVWFDFNQDGDFSDEGEELLVTAESSYQIGHSISVTIPTTALNGATRMRVRARYNGYNWGGGDMPHACGYDDYSEAEDYTVIIQGSEFNKPNNVFTFGSFDNGKFSIQKDGTTYNVTGSVDINDGVWHYLSATYGEDGMKLYVDGALAGTNNSVSGSLDPLRSGFWIGRYYDDRNGQYGFDGTIDEVRVSTSARNANWIQTEYNNQNSPGTFFALADGEARIMDHFDLESSIAEITARESVVLTIRAINNMGEAFVPYSGDKTLIFSGAASVGSIFPTATDKDGNKINFGDSTVLNFVDGAATTTLTLYKAETANIEVTDGAYDESLPLPIVVNSDGVVFIPPSKPVITQVEVLFNTDGSLNFKNIPENITQIAVSLTADFEEASWEDIKGMEYILKRYEDSGKFYIKFRTERGGVSEVMIVEKGKTVGSGGNEAPNSGDIQIILDGDIVKTAGNPDIYVIKYKNGKRYKRLLLSPLVFQSYGHLRWENVKIVPQEELDQFTTSNLVKETLDAIIYMLFPNGDAGEKKVFDILTPHDPDSVYEINAVDRDSYRMAD